MKRNQIIGAILGVIIIAGGAFYAGTAYGKGQVPAGGGGGKFSTQFGAGGSSRIGGRGGAGGFSAGQILSVSGTSMTIQQQNGSSSEIVILSPSTQVLKTTAGSASDLSTGTNVVVTGTPNSDGSLTAQSVQIRPAGMTGGFPGGRGGAGTPATQTTGQ